MGLRVAEMEGRERSEKPKGIRHTRERRWAIVQAVNRNQRVTVVDLSRQLGVSEVSIRRDLEHLEAMGLLRRVHGGAEALAQARQVVPFDARLLQKLEVKRAIGRAAAGLIHPGDVILLDAGTTVLEVARHIPRPLLTGGGLTVITRSLAIAYELRGYRDTRLMLLGGLYVPDFDDFVGAPVEDALRELHVDTLFIGIDGVTERGLATDNLLEVNLYRGMARSAERVVAVADSSKIGASRVQTILSFDEIHAFITDDAAPESFAQMLRTRSIEVMLVPSAER